MQYIVLSSTVWFIKFNNYIINLTINVKHFNIRNHNSDSYVKN